MQELQESVRFHVGEVMGTSTHQLEQSAYVFHSNQAQP